MSDKTKAELVRENVKLKLENQQLRKQVKTIENSIMDRLMAACNAFLHELRGGK